MRPSFLLWVLLAWLAVASGPAWAGASVSGRISNPQDESVSVTLGANVLTGQTVEAKAQLDADGRFQLDLKFVDRPMEVLLYHGDELAFLFLKPNDNLQLTADGNRPGLNLRFSGSGAAANNYLAQDAQKFGAPHQQAIEKLLETGTLAQVQQLVGTQRQQRLDFLRTYAAANSLPMDFRAYARQSILFGLANNLLMYPDALASAKANATAPARYYDFLVSLRSVQDSALVFNAQHFRAFVGAFATTRLAPAARAGGKDGWLALATQQFGTGRSRELALAKSLEFLLRDGAVGAATPLLPAFGRTVTDSTLAQTVRQLYLRRVELAPGRPAPALSLVDEQGKPFTLADFKGKVVYLDFWASWCGPCMEEIPASLALRLQFVGKDVVFLYVSVDNDETKWSEALGDFAGPSAQTVHAWAQGFGSPAARAYQVDKLPSYFIVGRDGRLASSPAPRPSDGAAVAAALKKALGK